MGDNLGVRWGTATDVHGLSTEASHDKRQVTRGPVYPRNESVGPWKPSNSRAQQPRADPEPFAIPRGAGLRYAQSMAARSVPDADSLRLELQEALAAFRSWTTHATQAFGVLATGDALLITYGFSQRLAAILFLASGLPVGVLLLYLQTMSTAAPLVIFAARIERSLSIKESLAAVYARSHLRPFAIAMNIDSLSNNELRGLDVDVSWRSWIGKLLPKLLYFTTLIQVGLAILSMTVYHYRFM